MNGSPSSRQRATPVASTRLSPRERPRSSHSPIRLNGRTPSSSEPCRRAGRWSYRISSRYLKRGMLLSSIIAGAETNRGKGGFGNYSSVLYEDVSMSPKKETQKFKGFTDEERLAMKDRIQELKA